MDVVSPTRRRRLPAFFDLPWRRSTRDEDTAMCRGDADDSGLWAAMTGALMGGESHQKVRCGDVLTYLPPFTLR